MTGLQGDIENVAGMSPKELTNMLELVSGSEAFRAEYDRLQGRQKEAEAKLRACFSNKKNVVAERKAKGDQKAEAERHLQHAKELVGMLFVVGSCPCLCVLVLCCSGAQECCCHVSLLRAPCAARRTADEPVGRPVHWPLICTPMTLS